MSRFSAFCLCLATLTTGLWLGGRTDRQTLSSTANADAPDAFAVQRSYDELRSHTSSLQEGSELLAKIARLTTSSVVHIQSTHSGGRRGGSVEETGSGVIVESEKAKGFYVVTNRHVVDGAALKNISIHMHDGRVLQPLEVRSDKATDVAVMKISASNLQGARWGDSDRVEIGNMVLAMGSPFGLSQSITYGIISAKGRRALRLGDASDVLNQDFLQTDAAINPGNSGGPLIDLHGQLIGINTAIASNSGGNEGIGFSIPCNLVRNVMDQLLENGKVTRAYLGVRLDPNFDSEAATRLKLDRVRGARVLEVYANTPASRAQLQFDDVVLTFDGVEVQDENHLINLVSLTDVSKRIKMVIFRGGQHKTIDVVVGDRSELEQRAQALSAPGMGARVEQLGLTVHSLEPNIAKHLGLVPETQGVLVLNIDRDSPVNPEVEMYDLIEEVAHSPVGSVEDLRNALRSADPEEPVLLKVRRQHQGRSQSHVIVIRQ